jgi:hypothetical protein
MVMSRTLQWVIGISVVAVALVVISAVVVPWVFSWFGWGAGRYGMMGSTYGSGGYGMMGGSYGSGGSGMMGGGSGMMGGGYGMMGGGGMMPWIGSQGGLRSGERLSLDEARAAAEDYAAAAGSDFAVAEVMEFENNFYAVVEETSTGRGAFELLVDPYTGAAGPEPGPNMMWNEKYGHMAFGSTAADRPSMQKAQAAAQAALEAQVPGVVVHETGMSFYGYHTFDFDGPDGNIAGMVSVEDDSGSVWLHTWHGDFISEWEADEATS